MRKFVFIPVLLLLPLLSRAQAGLEFASPVHDFGQTVLGSGPVSCTFTGINRSSVPVTIQSVTTSCGCTNVKWNHDPVKPGAAVSISVTYSNDEAPAPFDKTVTVSVLGRPSPILLHIRGVSVREIKPDREVYTFLYGGRIGLTSDSFKCGNIEQGRSRSDETTVANLSSEPVNVTFSNVSDGLSLSVVPNPVPAGKHASLKYSVTSRPDKWGTNIYDATLVLNGKSSGRKISIKALTAENFSSYTKEERAHGSRPVFEESTYSFGHKKQGAVVNAVFTCTNSGKAPLSVHKVESDCAGVVPGAFPLVEPGSSGRFSVRLDTGNLPRGEALVTVTLITNSPMRPLVILFLAGWID